MNESSVVAMEPQNNNPIAISEDPILSMIERVITNPDADVSKMQTLMEMRNQELIRVEQSQEKELLRLARLEFNRDYVSMGDEMPLVLKSKYNKFTKSNYAAHENVMQAIKPILSKHGFALSCEVAGQTNEDVTVAAILIHKNGHEKSTKITMKIDTTGSGGTVNKTTIQGTASAITYAKRVSICTLLNISTGDDADGNREQERPLATTAQRTAMMNLYKKLTTEQQENFDTRTGGVLQITQDGVDKVIAMLNKSISGGE